MATKPSLFEEGQNVEVRHHEWPVDDGITQRYASAPWRRAHAPMIEHGIRPSLRAPR